MTITNSTFTLPPVVSAEIFAKAQELSIVQQLATQTELPGQGTQISVVTSEPEAEWVAELGTKPADSHGLSTKIMAAHKIALIEVFSDEFREDQATLANALIARLPAAIARTFDSTVFSGPAPGANFDTLSAADVVSLGSDSYASIIEGFTSVAAADGDVSSVLVSPVGELALLGARDGNERPFYTSNPQTDGIIGGLLGKPVYKSKYLTHDVDVAGNDESVIALAGDWTNSRWGTVSGIKVDIATQGTVTKGADTINLFQQNAFAVRVEARVGFVTKDVNHFVKFVK